MSQHCCRNEHSYRLTNGQELYKGEKGAPREEKGMSWVADTEGSEWAQEMVGSLSWEES